MPDQHPGIPKIICQEFPEGFLLAYLSNGLIGIRPGSNPLTQPETVVSGYVYSHSHGGFETYALVPYPLRTDVKVDRVSLLENPSKLSILSQTLNTATGELVTDMTFAPNAHTQLDLRILQFASRSLTCLLCQEISVTASTDTQIQVCPGIDMNGIPGKVYGDLRASILQTYMDQVAGIALTIANWA